MADLLHPINPDDPRASLGTEWLLTNGIGGFAMGTVPGANNRGYHGLLVAATAPPAGRVLALHGLVEQLEIGDERIDLSTKLFEGGALLHPEGWRSLTRFTCDPPGACTWTHEIGAIVVERQLALARGRNAITVTYRVTGLEAPARLLVRPFTPLRNFHHVDREDASSVPSLVAGREASGPVRLARDGVALDLRFGDGRWRTDPQWWHRLAYLEDRARGLPWIEDVWSSGVIEYALAPSGTVVLRLEAEVVGDEPIRMPVVIDGGDARAASPARRLERAADQFVVQRHGLQGASTTIIAGYPWFADWGRDSMISLPGLLVASGRHEEAQSVLLTFARHMRHGIVPNRFHDTEPPIHNTVDASLWFVEAVGACASFLPDETRAELVDACRSVERAYRDGTDFGIRLDEDDLIASGDGASALTWMDACHDGVAFTPREGKAVEINALWHNALCRLAGLTGDASEAARLRRDAARTATSLRRRFWWNERRCLHDVLIAAPSGSSARGDEWRPDERLRPNQIFAVSLPHSALTAPQQRDVVTAVERTLLTPYGLRTLDPDHGEYRGRFEGNLAQRDAAYHNGTVWPWLIGPYIAAALRARGAAPTVVAHLRRTLAPLVGELDRGCLDQIAEVYDGDPPHRASGCPAQAWSVAEVRRALALIEAADARAASEPTARLATP